MRNLVSALCTVLVLAQLASAASIHDAQGANDRVKWKIADVAPRLAARLACKMRVDPTLEQCAVGREVNVFLQTHGDIVQQVEIVCTLPFRRSRGAVIGTSEVFFPGHPELAGWLSSTSEYVARTGKLRTETVDGVSVHVARVRPPEWREYYIIVSFPEVSESVSWSGQ